MADVKISELTALTTPSGGEELVVNASGTTKKITQANLLKGINNTAADATAITILANENVGIGETSPARFLHVKDPTGGNIVAFFESTDANGSLSIGDSSGSVNVESDAGAMVLSVDGNTSNGGGLTQAVTISTAGNVGIGVTPEAHHNSHSALQVGGNGVWTSYKPQGASGEMDFQHNAYYSQAHGGDRYISTDEATKYRQVSGAHQWYTAGSGSADAAISWRYGMQINNDGIVTKPLQPAFSAYRTLGNVTSGVYICNGEHFDTGGDHSTSNGRFTAPVAGRYMISSFLMSQTDNTYTNKAYTIRVNGGIYKEAYGSSGGNVHHQFNWMGIIQLAANDYVTLNYQNFTMYGGGHTYSTFSGYLLG